MTDKALADWRRRNPELTVERPPAVADIVCGSSYLDLSRNSAAILTVPGERVAAVERLAADLAAVALPWFATTRDPAALAEAVPAAALRPTAFAQDLLELLVSRDLTGPAEALIGRFTSISPAHEAAFAEGLGPAAARPGTPRPRSAGAAGCWAWPEQTIRLKILCPCGSINLGQRQRRENTSCLSHRVCDKQPNRFPNAPLCLKRRRPIHRTGRADLAAPRRSVTSNGRAASWRCRRRKSADSPATRR